MVNIASLLIKKNILISTYIRKQYVSLENVPMLQVSVQKIITLKIVLGIP